MHANRGDTPNVSRETIAQVSQDVSRETLIRELIMISTQLVVQIREVFIPLRDSFTKHTREWYQAQELIDANMSAIARVQALIMDKTHE